MKTESCPRCKRVDAVAKVSGIVAGGTRISDSTTFTMTPSLGDDEDVDWSLNYQQTINTSQSTLTTQLTFPAKGEGAMIGGWLLFVVLVIVFIALLAYEGSLFDDGANNGFTAELNSEINSVGNWLTAIFLGGIGFFFFAIIATGVHTARRPEALAVWNTLYYCFRDDVVYVPGNAKQCVPPSQMRMALLHY
jgi:hypothetical protein